MSTKHRVSKAEDLAHRLAAKDAEIATLRENASAFLQTIADKSAEIARLLQDQDSHLWEIDRKTAEIARLLQEQVDYALIVVEQDLEIARLREALERLIGWADYMGGFEAQSWSNARAALRGEKE